MSSNGGVTINSSGPINGPSIALTPGMQPTRPMLRELSTPAGTGLCAGVHVWLCACVVVCMCGCVHVWLCACVVVCMCGCVVVWLCACVVVWLCTGVVVWLCIGVLVWLCGCVVVYWCTGVVVVTILFHIA